MKVRKLTSWIGALDGDPRFVIDGGELGPDSVDMQSGSGKGRNS